MKWYSNIKKYAEKSREKYIFSVLFAFVETGKVFKRVSKDKYLQFRSILSTIITIKHMHRKNNVKILGRSMCRCFTNLTVLVISISVSGTSGTDLTQVVGGGGDTFRDIYTYKKEKKVNTNFAFMLRARMQMLKAARGRRSISQ